MLCHCAIRRTETPIPAMHGRPPRISGRREIRLAISVTVAIDLKYNALRHSSREERRGYPSLLDEVRTNRGAAETGAEEWRRKRHGTGRHRAPAILNV